MQFKVLFTLSCLVLTGNVAIAGMLEHGDVPNQCRNACEPVVDISESCERQHNNDESAEHQCICNWGPAKTQVPLCAACIDQYDPKNFDNGGNGNDDDDDNNDADDDNRGDGNRGNNGFDIIHACSFSTTSYNSAEATTLSSSGASVAINTATATATGSNRAGNGSAGSDSGSESSPNPTADAAAGLSAPSAPSLIFVAGLVHLLWL